MCILCMYVIIWPCRKYNVYHAFVDLSVMADLHEKEER